MMKRFVVPILVLGLTSWLSMAEPPRSAASPAAFFATHPHILDGDCDPPLEWRFSTNGTFDAWSKTSTYGFGITGAWSVVKGGSVQVVGRSSNTRTKETLQVDNLITNVLIRSTNELPSVWLQKVWRIKAFKEQPTTPRTVP